MIGIMSHYEYSMGSFGEHFATRLSNRIGGSRLGVSPQLLCPGHSRLKDGDAGVQLVGPLAVVVRPGALALAREAPPVLLLGDATAVVEGNAGVLLSAWVVGHRHHALLVLHHVRVRAAGAGVLLDGGELLVAHGREGVGVARA